MPADLTLPQLAAIWSAVFIAYVIFSIAGFGTALVAGPLLAQRLPLAQIVPLLALLDLFAALGNLLRDGGKADLAELGRLVPLMLAGSGIGAAILLITRAEVLLLLLGLFAVGYALYALSGYRPAAKFTPAAAVPFGLMGGVFSALFGSGGFLYAIYLSGRIEDKQRMRVTQSTLISCSTLTRLVFFLLAGVYADHGLLLLAAVLATAMLAGVATGRQLTMKLSRERFLAIVNLAVLGSGLSLLFRYFF